MLAFMPPQLFLHTPSETNTMTMSLAILPPQSMAYNEQSVPALLRPSPAKRPKLSLDTNNVPSIFGKGSTSLRLDTLSATSPTARNTFRNALDPAHLHNKKSSRLSRTPLAISTNVAQEDEPVTQLTPTNESAESSATTTTSVSSIDSIPSVVPYKRAFNTSSILVNSPIPRPPRRALFNHSRPMFPAPKKVAFREPLTEDVKTTRFTLRHSDIDSSTSTISTLELTPSDSRNAELSQDKQTGSASNQSGANSPQTGDKRESSDEEDSDHGSCPATPVAGRRKRHRQWVWTLGPVESNKDSSPPQHNPDSGNGVECKEGHR